MSKLLVLGASRYQLPVIRKARSMGLKVIAADNDPSSPGRPAADMAFDCDTTDVQAVAALAEREQVSGVIAPATDAALPALAEAAARLGLFGPSPEAARVLSAKVLFRALQAELGLPAPACTLFSEPKWPEGLERRGGPWALKPNRSSGSKGVFRVTNQEEFLRLAPESLKWSTDSLAVLEDWVEGTQHTCEGVMRGGKAAGLMLTDRVTAPFPFAATWGHFCPPLGFEAAAAEDLAAQIEAAFKRLGYADGPFDCDFVRGKGPKRNVMLELSPRLGGNSLSALYRVSMKADIERFAVCLACGLPTEFEPRQVPRCAAVILLGTASRGRLVWDREAASRLQKEQWVLSFEMDLPYGAPAEPFTHGRNRAGEALICGDSPRTTRLLAESFRTRLSMKTA
ncbi:MAG: hypothetical protein LBW85_08670 [Deltaproteobacteria bacterium]|jgi:biotin carboxylase|nr:hypothetical protein [Deltaproteobacteria bacterium]